MRHQPLNRSFLKRSRWKLSADFRPHPKIWPSPDLTKLLPMKCKAVRDMCGYLT